MHLLVQDPGKGEIAKSMQLIAGRTAQEYNQRKGRKGAYWEDRYHATAIDTDDYLAKCMVYIDLNMVRAGVVSHPGEWDVCGYSETKISCRVCSVSVSLLIYKACIVNGMMRHLRLKDRIVMNPGQTVWQLVVMLL
jgi:putative transposase